MCFFKTVLYILFLCDVNQGCGVGVGVGARSRRSRMFWVESESESESNFIDAWSRSRSRESNFRDAWSRSRSRSRNISSDSDSFKCLEFISVTFSTLSSFLRLFGMFAFVIPTFCVEISFWDAYVFHNGKMFPVTTIFSLWCILYSNFIFSMQVEYTLSSRKLETHRIIFPHIFRNQTLCYHTIEPMLKNTLTIIIPRGNFVVATPTIGDISQWLISRQTNWNCIDWFVFNWLCDIQFNFE